MPLSSLLAIFAMTKVHQNINIMTQEDLKPAGIFSFFDEICRVPRPSKKEEKIIAYLQDFGRKHNIETHTDEAGNVIMRKPATPGMEDRKAVVLQSHMDMVCDCLKSVEHDFMKDPVETYIDGEWLRAKGTTLGADNGIGVATELAILTDDSIEHGPIECLFTRDEETGLTGAFAMKEGFMHGDILLNLDSEDEGQIFIGCAGGMDTEGRMTYSAIDVPDGYYACRIEVKGLQGGHSGDDIDKGRANANKILNRFLMKATSRYDTYLCEIDGGSLRNAIAREAHAVIALPEGDKHSLRADLNIFASEVKDEYHTTEPDMLIAMESVPCPANAIDGDSAKRLLQTVCAMPHGVYAMSQDVTGLVETSTNLASVKMTNGHSITICTSQRSSTASSKKDIATMVRTVFLMGGFVVSYSDGYPGWKPNTHSEILQVAVESYRRLFGTEPEVKAIHAGLECGLFLSKYPHMDMISFGPTLRGVHSPDERMHIPSVEKFWRHLLDILKNIPVKK